mgnify:FL=1
MRKRRISSDDEHKKLAAELEEGKKSAEALRDRYVQTTLDGPDLESRLENFMLDLLSNLANPCSDGTHAQKEEDDDRDLHPGEKENIIVSIELETTRFIKIFESVNKCIERTGKEFESVRKRLSGHQ